MPRFLNRRTQGTRNATTNKDQLLNNLIGLLNYFILSLKTGSYQEFRKRIAGRGDSPGGTIDVGKSYLFLSEVEGFLGGGVLTSRAPVCGSCPLQVECPSL